MNNVFKKLFLVFSLMVFAQSLVANEEDDLKQHFYDKLENIKTVINQNKNQKSKEKTYQEIISILTPVFDFELMAKLSLGKSQWHSISKDDRSKFVSIYTNRMKNSYSSKLDTYNNEKIEIYSVVRKKTRMILKTSIESNDKTLEVNYKFYKPKKRKSNKDLWLIYDVEILGISILKADKAQFRDFLHSKNMSSLMDALANQL